MNIICAIVYLSRPICLKIYWLYVEVCNNVLFSLQGLFSFIPCQESWWVLCIFENKYNVNETGLETICISPLKRQERMSHLQEFLTDSSRGLVEVITKAAWIKSWMMG